MEGVHAPQVAAGIAQVGEFSFVLAPLGAAHGLLPPAAYTGLVAGVVIAIPVSSVLARIVRARRSDPAIER